MSTPKPRGRSEAAAHVRPFPSLLHQTSNASTLSNGSTVMEDAEFPLSPMAAAGEGLGDLCSTPCFGRPSRFGQPVAHRCSSWRPHQLLYTCAHNKVASVSQIS